MKTRETRNLDRHHAFQLNNKTAFGLAMISWKLTQVSKGKCCDSKLNIADGNTTHIKGTMEIELLCFEIIITF